MGGGEGSKERRRLHRQKMRGQTTSDKATGRKVGYEPVESSYPQNKHSEHASNSVVKKSNTKKVKKPKHLKRKLEQLSPDDEQTRDIVLKEIAHFQETKAGFALKPSRSGQKRAKHQSTERERERKRELESSKMNRVLSVLHEEKTTATSTASPEQLPENEEAKEKNVGQIDGGTSEDEGDSSNLQEDAPMRERGRRHRGRKDTAKQIQETQAKSEFSKGTKVENSKTTEETPPDESNFANRRYCIGRKPVTDFVIGQKYTGKVVYTKDFGVFFDIGCHSDAFCHVSRLRDGFVENPQEIFKEGDEIQARVIEIDRKRKRITLSLQSDERLSDEKASLEAREERKRSRKNSERKNASKPLKERAEKKERSDRTSHDGKSGRVPPPAVPKDAREASLSTEVTPAEQKRARKLARRAARREQVP